MSFRVESIQIGTTAPTFPKVDEVWIDTSLVPPLLKVYDGKTWMTCGVPGPPGPPVSEIDGGAAA